MKNWSSKKIIVFGMALIMGTILYDFLLHESVDYLRAFGVGLIGMLIVVIYQSMVSKI